VVLDVEDAVVDAEAAVVVDMAPDTENDPRSNLSQTMPIELS